MSNETTNERDGLFEMAAAFVGGATRIGLTVASVPLVLLPRNSRRRVRRAMAEVALAVVAFPKELANVSERIVDEIVAAEPPQVSLPSPRQVGEQVRSFTERLSRAAEELGTSFSRAAGRAADAVEQGAAKVDEWVETPPKTPPAQ
ncbi:MAG: hypothetical protein KatS3mg055_2922 [Chloroflexus sp.]|uniref:hypothetical protein n=1 Tax=Chloroflexus sp. TaxID=1904827 RepID=UPI0021DEE32F|nr:hypothetical protein [Chloroflexus sp.]GIV90404.1 MAG: hypothetical protein KatS3mg055_2922 [Chloroflexus sp.]